MRAILAVDEEWGIGKDGGMPWPNNGLDMAWFKDITAAGTVIMGRGTWESNGMSKPLPGRTNVVVSSGRIRDHSLADDVLTLDQLYESKYLTKNNWIIGGAQLVKTLLPFISEMFITRIPGKYGCTASLDSSLILDQFVVQYTIRINETLVVEKYKRK